MTGAKEYKEEIMQEEAEERGESAFRLHQEEHQAAGAFCSNCGTNWGVLRTDYEEEEDYTTCPYCHTDSFLEAVRPGPRFTLSPLSGDKYNVETGEVEAFRPAPPPVLPDNPVEFDFAAYYAREQERQQKEDKAIDRYLAILAVEGEEAAHKAFHQHKNQ